MRILAPLLLLLPFTLIAQDPDGAYDLVRKGLDLQKQRSYAEAIKLYDQALELDRNNFYAMAEKANSLFAMGEYQDCVDLCEQTVDLHGAHEEIAMVYIAAANSLDHLKRPDEALRMYRRGQERAPNEYQLYYNEGVTLVGMDRRDEAIRSFRRSAQLNPRHASSQNALGRLEGMSNNKLPALLCLSRFLIIEPEGGRAESNLPLVQQLMKGDVEQTGKGKVTIRVDGSRMPAEGDTTAREDDFSAVELMIAMLSATDFEKKNQKRPAVDLFEEKFSTLCGLLGELQPKNTGFYWEFYVPYFAELKDRGHVRAAVMVMHASSTDPVVKKWLKANEKALGEFFTWSREYNWERRRL